MQTSEMTHLLPHALTGHALLYLGDDAGGQALRHRDTPLTNNNINNKWNIIINNAKKCYIFLSWFICNFSLYLVLVINFESV